MRTIVSTVLIGVALLAAPYPPSAEPVLKNGKFIWFTLDETMEDVARSLGPPASVADFGEDFRTCHYRLGGVDEHDPSHYLVFRRSTGRLISVTRGYEPEQLVDAMFPARETTVAFASGAAPMGARVRKLSANRLLIALGSVKAGQPTGQLALIREDEVKQFFPWIAGKK